MNAPRLALLSLAALTLASAGVAQGKEYLPSDLHGVDVQERLGEQVPADLTFINHEGERVRLGDLVHGDVPVLLTLNYYSCKMLCNLQLNALLKGLRGTGWTPGQEFRIVTVSIDPREGWELARDKRLNYLDSLELEGATWEFLVGDEASIKTLADSVGFQYRYQEELDQYAHTAAIFFLSPKGTISRYLYGLEYLARDIRFALLDAAEGRLSNTVDKVLMSCFYYDASIGAYGPFAFGVMRVGGAFIVLSLSIFLSFMWRIERRRDEEIQS